MTETLEWFVCKTEEFEHISKRRFQIHTRDIVVIRRGGLFFALDSFCYHAGGPLYMGDIEDFNGLSCLVCPWHHYKVHIDTGNMVYQSIDPHNLNKPAVWRNSGQKQRVHHMTIRDDSLFVTFSDCTGDLQSDQYNTKEYRERWQAHS
uniref:Rieske domain-containing protein-like n=1 Tax=Crassostrea virginica TaxID=6565 RepID=A0A8B8CCI3_CRAVI|nr:Rieske domain-containing protein-like [Crassostrea virginica]